MSTIAIEINDAGLAVARDGRLLAIEPGYAIVEGGEIRTGHAAYGQARLKPQLVSNRFWSNISLDPAEPGAIGSVNTAELAYAQMQKLWSEYGRDANDAVLIVPPHYSAQDLGLLLGLAQECGIDVRAMIDTAVAATMRAYPGRQILHVDAGLHRVFVAPIGQGDEVTVGDTASLETAGISSIFDTFAKRIARAFVLSTRFDPMHDARSEQQLYDRLPEWLDKLSDDVSIEAVWADGDDEFVVEIERDQLLSVAAGFYRAVVQLIAQHRDSSMPVVLQLSSRLARLPGLVAELSRLDDAQIVSLEDGHAVLSVLARVDAIRLNGTDIKLLKHLPWHDSPIDAPEKVTVRQDAANASVPARQDIPTHVVYRGVAYALNRGPIVVGREQSGDRRAIEIADGHTGVSRAHCELTRRDGEVRIRDTSRYGTFINEKRVAGEAILNPADVIRIGTPGAELQLIVIEADDGA